MIAGQFELVSQSGSERLANVLMLEQVGPLCGPSRMNPLQGATLGREDESNQGSFIKPSSASSSRALAKAQR